MDICFINYIDEHNGSFTFFITFLTFAALIWYAWETRRLVTRTTESLTITKEKEKVDRALEFIDRYVRKGFKRSIAESIDYLSEKYSELYNEGMELDVYKDFEVNQEFNRILIFYNLIAYLIEKGKIEYDIIKDYFGEDLVTFAFDFDIQIKQLISLNTALKLKRNYKNYFALCIKLEEELKFIDNKEFIKNLENGFEDIVKD